jgi:hypothetical protein
LPKKIGIEPNVSAADVMLGQAIKHFLSPSDALQSLGKESVGFIISNHAIVHTLNPWEELKALSSM